MHTASYGGPSSPSIWVLWWGYLSSAGHSTFILVLLQCHTFSVELASPLGALTDPSPCSPQFSLHKDLLMGCGSIQGSAVIGVEGCANCF